MKRARDAEVLIAGQGASQNAGTQRSAIGRVFENPPVHKVAISALRETWYVSVMSSWTVHLCNARKRLTPFASTVAGGLQAAQAKCEEVHPPTSVDIVVRAADRAMPEGLEVGGSSFAPGRIDIDIDINARLNEEQLYHAVLRTAFHEFHHVLRWDGPGYGFTLGEALASEGLAQIFVHEMMDCPPEPWESVLNETELADLRKVSRTEFENATYNHPEWFFGAGRFRAWAGYSLGKFMIEKALLDIGTTALESATRPADQFKPYL